MSVEAPEMPQTEYHQPELHFPSQAELDAAETRQKVQAAFDTELAYNQRPISERLEDLNNDPDDPFRASKALQLEAALREQARQPHVGPTPVYKGKGRVIAHENGKRITAGDAEAVERLSSGEIDFRGEVEAMEKKSDWLKDVYDAAQEARAKGEEIDLGLTPSEAEEYQSYSDRRILAADTQDRINQGNVRNRDEAVEYLRGIESQYGADSDEAAFALARVGSHLSPKTYVKFVEHGKRETAERERIQSMSSQEAASMSPAEAEAITKKFPHLEKLLYRKQVGAQHRVPKNARFRPSASVRPGDVKVAGEYSPAAPVVEEQAPSEVPAPGMFTSNGRGRLPSRVINIEPVIEGPSVSQPQPEAPAQPQVEQPQQEGIVLGMGPERTVDTERRPSRWTRRKLVAGAMAVAAALGATGTGLGISLGEGGPSHESATSAPAHPGHKQSERQNEAQAQGKQKNKGNRESHIPATTAVILPEYNPATGDGTIWKLVEDEFKSHGIENPSPKDIYKRTKEVIEANRLTFSKARKLPDGDLLGWPEWKGRK